MYSQELELFASRDVLGLMNFSEISINSEQDLLQMPNLE